MSAQAESQIRVYVEDTDASGVVYHANYLRFLERARTEMMRALGLQQSATYRQNVAFVVHSLQLRFFQGARLDDLLTVKTAVANLRAASLVFAQQVLLPDGATACKAEVTVACVNLETQRARRIPADLLGRVKQLPPDTP